ncbi:hypothetical protein SELMODRAFT_76236 [Selaginella moellendorffii]|uniref:Pentacotripeptide-repeat region of PRORP domain-containing protein n=1 Tax=Selaginella moellendorffii TaxID=88036 RepID=D8QT94_SELML|nr:hypothetical protein SELMODRAFT_76236 [Selaginella moellendorffii]
MPWRDLISWNAMIAVYALNGHHALSLELFLAMAMEGLEPSDVTFSSVLTACAHAGMIDRCSSCLESMRSDYSIEETLEHRRALVDILGRSGQLHRAREMIQQQSGDGISWTTLVGSCKIHGNPDLAKHAARQAFSLDAKNSAPYVLLHSIQIPAT